MNVTTEIHAEFDLLRYSGTHGCSDDDHAKDEWVRKYVDDRVSAGQNRFLVDVRNLRVVYGSGIGDLLTSWRCQSVSGTPAPDVRSGRVAILWSPLRKGTDRWASLIRAVEKGGVASKWIRFDHAEMGTQFFVDEDDASSILLDEE